MERAVWNLLENAGKWSGNGGSVEVSLAGGELRVRDHGPGITPTRYLMRMGRTLSRVDSVSRPPVE